ncbi:hypothetical protein GPAL_2106 [Glaciecola pallidula DSM 14239 = ACAM 615]|uniref:Uncharacterized protein n=1 Tax=Brumicola pallidula DSM 14239 = ACAM 615 TaxID=1121922 RepID=K6ZF41_9ALTE|nr:hypothetical protein GPAL_2106 [Glaciecola pallidula DSM 14239 = ACAM 615]
MPSFQITGSVIQIPLDNFCFLIELVMDSKFFKYLSELP